jgi:hypothetical protein
MFTIHITQPRDAQSLLTAVRQKIETVRKYEAKARLTIDVSFMKVPPSEVQVSFTQPDQFQIKNQGGVSILPKGGLHLSLGTLLQPGEFAIVDAGIENNLRKIKLIPLKDGGDIVLSTLYIDEKSLLVRKAITSTRENGTYELDLDYGKYAAYALPDKAVFLFNTNGYKMPKGLSLDYDPHGTDAKAPPPGEAKGSVTLAYESYAIN